MMFNEAIKKYDVWDIYLIMLASIALAYFIITVPSVARNVVMQWVHAVHWGWWLAAVVIFAARPKMKLWAR